jgi:hypothetical protein
MSRSYEMLRLPCGRTRKKPVTCTFRATAHHPMRRPGGGTIEPHGRQPDRRVSRPGAG